jgi:hypothetical protein
MEKLGSVTVEFQPRPPSQRVQEGTERHELACIEAFGTAFLLSTAVFIA